MWINLAVYSVVLPCPVICKQCAVWNLKISIFNMFSNPVTKFLNQRQAVKFRLQERKYLRHLKVLTESLKSSSRSFLCMLTNLLTLSSNPSKARISFKTFYLLNYYPIYCKELCGIGSTRTTSPIKERIYSPCGYQLPVTLPKIC